MNWLRPAPEKADPADFLDGNSLEHAEKARNRSALILGASTVALLVSTPFDKTGLIPFVSTVTSWLQILQLNGRNEVLLAHANAVERFPHLLPTTSGQAASES